MTRFSRTPAPRGASARRRSGLIDAVGPYPFLAPLLTIAFAALYGGFSALVPLVKLDLIILLLAVFVGFLSHAALRVSGARALAFAFLAGLGGVVAMWALWLGLRHGFATLTQVALQGPLALWRMIALLAQTATVNVPPLTGSGRAMTVGPQMMTALWLIETLGVGLAPLWGAAVGLRRRRAELTRA